MAAFFSASAATATAITLVANNTSEYTSSGSTISFPGPTQTIYSSPAPTARDEHAASWSEAWKAIERRREFRGFVLACTSRPTRTPKRPQSPLRLIAHTAWRVRALAKMPGT